MHNRKEVEVYKSTSLLQWP